MTVFMDNIPLTQRRIDIFISMARFKLHLLLLRYNGKFAFFWTFQKIAFFWEQL
jgi:hypothetical protein